MKKDNVRHYAMTPRQHQVLVAVAAAGNLAEAAEDLGISSSTARVHMVGVAKALGTVGKGTLATVLEAARLGIITIEEKQ